MVHHVCTVCAPCVHVKLCYFLICITGQSIKMFIRGRPITMYVPSNIQNYDDLKMELPLERLELDWVYPSRWGKRSSSGFYLCLTAPEESC